MFRSLEAMEPGLAVRAGYLAMRLLTHRSAQFRELLLERPDTLMDETSPEVIAGVRSIVREIEAAAERTIPELTRSNADDYISRLGEILDRLYRIDDADARARAHRTLNEWRRTASV